MPFFPPFRTGFDSGDIVYGLGGARKIYRHNFRIGCFDFFNFDPMRGGATIDQYALCKTEIDYRAEHFPTFRVPDKNREFQEFVGRHQKEKYRSLLDARPTYVQIAGSDIPGIEFSNQFLRRKCKAGLDWSTSLAANNHVHFLLDFIDCQAIVDKRSVGNSMNERSVTGSELRWIYRNRDNPNVQNGIQFWFEFKAVSPPWFVPSGGSSSYWSMYVPRAEASSSAELSRLFDTP